MKSIQRSSIINCQLFSKEAKEALSTTPNENGYISRNHVDKCHSVCWHNKKVQKTVKLVIIITILFNNNNNNTTYQHYKTCDVSTTAKHCQLSTMQNGPNKKLAKEYR